MKYCLAPVVEIADVREALRMQYGPDFMDPREFSYFEMAEPDSYIKVSFDEEALADNVEERAYCEDDRPEEVGRVIGEACMLDYFASVITNFDYVLIHIDR